MREIKFRGKRIDNGEWILGNLIGSDVIVGEIVEWDSEYFNTEFWMKVDPETVGQFTGLYDDTEGTKEVFEGDLVNIEHDGSEVICEVMLESGGVLLVSNVLEDGYIFAHDRIDNDGRLEWIRGSEVVGKKHDNI